MGYALSALLTSLQMIACSLLFDVFFIRKYEHKKHYAVLMLWAAISILVANITQNNIGIPLFIVEIVIYYGMNLTLYMGHWDRRLFVTITHYATIFTITYLTQMAFAAALQTTRQELVKQHGYYTLVIILNMGECFLFPLLMRYFHRIPVMPQKTRMWLPPALFFPVCTLFMLVMAQTARDNIPWMVGLFTLCVTDISALLLLDQLENASLLREMLAVSHQRILVQQANMKALSDSYTKQRKMTHDFRKYIAVLSEMLEQGNVAQAKQYLQELKVGQTERILLVNSHNPLLDAILNQEGYAAQNKNIDIQFVLNDLSKIR